MTRTLRRIAVLMTAGLLGAAFAAGSSTTPTTNGNQTQAGSPQAAASPAGSGLVGQALRDTKVTLLAGAPGSGAKVIATEQASKLVNGQGNQPITGARYAKLTIAGHSAAFAVADTGGQNGPTFAVTGVPGSSSKGSTTLSALATYVYNAVQGTSPAVMLERGSGADAVVFAVYDPSKPAPSLKTSGATQAMVVVNGHVTSYRVNASGQGLQNLTIASGAHKGQKLTSVIG